LGFQTASTSKSIYWLIVEFHQILVLLRGLWLLDRDFNLWTL
jgi:hypothetical protein